MAIELTPRNFWKLQTMPSMWEDIEDLLPATFPTLNNLSGLSIAEDGKNVYIEASVPGVNPDDVEVTVHKGVLWIKAEAKEEEKGKKYYRKATSSFSYRVALPEDVDAAKEPDAVCENGVMKVTFARSAKTQPKKIAVKVVGKKSAEKK